MKKPERGRIIRLRRHMAVSGIEALLVTERENVRYLTGFRGSAGVVLVASGRPCLLTDFRYMIQARRETSGVAILIQKTDWTAALREILLRSNVSSLWYDESSLPIETYEKLKKAGLKLKKGGGLVAKLRRQKDVAELARIRKAIRRAEQSFLELRKYIKPGAAERELGLRLEFLMREKGSRRAAFDTIVASGKNGAMPHASVSTRRIKAGDLVTFDFGAEADGYFSDITRTVCVGKPSARQREIHALVLNAQRAAIKAIYPGVPCKLADDAARGVIQESGHGKHFGHATGHGVGLMVHEAPALSSLSNMMVDKGMVVTVEPGVYIPGWGGVRIEDMIVVTDKGAKVLTTLPREL